MLPFSGLLPVSEFQDRTQNLQNHAMVMCMLSVVYLWLINVIYWNHLRKNHKHWKLQKKSDIFAIIKLVMEHYLQWLTHVHHPRLTLPGTFQASTQAKTPEFLKHMYQKAHDPERAAIFIFVWKEPVILSIFYPWCKAHYQDQMPVKARQKEQTFFFFLWQPGI